MRKSQYYILAGASFLLSLIFGAFAKNRRNICDSQAQVLFDYCIQRYTTFVVIGVIILVLALIFFIFGLFEKNSKN